MIHEPGTNDGFAALARSQSWSDATVDVQSRRSVAMAVRLILAASCLASPLPAPADTQLPPTIVTPGPTDPGGPGRGGGGGANYPTPDPRQDPLPEPYDCAAHASQRPAECPYRQTRPSGSRYSGQGDPDYFSALGRLFAYLDSVQPNVSPVSRNVMETALNRHTEAIAGGIQTMPGTHLDLYRDLQWACEAQVEFDPEVYPDPVPWWQTETRLLNDTARDCFQALFAMERELGLAGPSIFDAVTGWVSETISRILGTPVSTSVGIEGQVVGPITLSIDPRTVDGSLAEKWKSGRDQATCASWYEVADSNGCQVD